MSTDPTTTRAALWNDMREFMEFLEEQGDLIHITEEVDPFTEVSGITRIFLQNEGPAVVFDNLKGADYPVVTGLLATDRRYLQALGVKQWSEFNDWWVKQTEILIPPVIVASGPCQENVIEEADVDITRICNIKWHQFDKGGSAGDEYGHAFPGTLSISITKDLDNGLQNAGIYRMGTLGRNRLGWGAPEYTHGRQHYMKYEAMNQRMPMAVITGYDPITEIVACTRTPPNVDEFWLAGALRGEPLEMVKCRTIDIEVPATSEWVFEGYVEPHYREAEGGFGEYTGHYGETRMNPVFVITCITHRNDPIYLGTREQWKPSESSLCNGASSQAVAFKTLKELVPGILDLRCDVSYEAIVKIKKLFKGHPQQVMNAVWGATYARYKHCIVVDEDIDIWNYDRVHWALSTRVRAGRDVVIMPRCAGQWLDPAPSLREKGWQDGLGIDATTSFEEYEFWGEKVPRLVDDPENVAEVLAKWGPKLGYTSCD